MLGEQHAELVVGACMARIQAQRLPQARLCLGRLPQRQGGHTQQVPHLAVVGFGLHEPAINRSRALDVSSLVVTAGLIESFRQGRDGRRGDRSSARLGGGHAEAFEADRRGCRAGVS